MAQELYIAINDDKRDDLTPETLLRNLEGVKDLTVEGFSTEDLLAVIMILQASQTLETLVIRRIEISDCKTLADLLKNSSITSLELDGNKIGDAGVEVLAEVLKKSNLVNFSVCNNSIGDPGAEAIAKGLDGSEVNQVVLPNNKIGDQGALALAAVLNGSFYGTNLSGNKISEAGIAALQAAAPDDLKVNNQLVEEAVAEDMSDLAVGGPGGVDPLGATGEEVAAE